MAISKTLQRIIDLKQSILKKTEALWNDTQVPEYDYTLKLEDLEEEFERAWETLDIRSLKKIDKELTLILDMQNA